MRLRDKVAIVTGGANGIGRATAAIFAREGAKVVIADRDTNNGRACAREIRAGGAEGEFAETDVSRDADVSALIVEVIGRFGGLDILVNSAGVALSGTVVDTEGDRWQRVLDVILASVYHTCRRVVPPMIDGGGGSIVNVASIQGLYGVPNYAAYAASKAGIIGLTRQIAVDYAASNIRANIVSPGSIVTDIVANTVRLEPELASDRHRQSIPTARNRAVGADPKPALLRSGTPENVAYAILFLASDEAGHVSGHNLVVDGIATARA